jgi:signal peptidase II
VRSPARLVVLLVAFVTIGCDQVTKHAARGQLAGQPRQTYLGDAVRLEYAENRGAFLSLGAEWPRWARFTSFTLAPAVVLLVIGVWSLQKPWPPLRRIALGLVWAGGVSNLVDRVLHGAVVDFMNVGIGWLRTGIFNVADVAITLGVLLLAAYGTERDGPRP